MNQYQKILQTMQLMSFYFKNPEEIKEQIDIQLQELKTECNQALLNHYYENLKQMWSNDDEVNQGEQQNQNQRIKISDLKTEQRQAFSDFPIQFELRLMHLKTDKQSFKQIQNTKQNLIEVINEKRKIMEQLDALDKSEKSLKEENKLLKLQIEQLRNEIQDLKKLMINNQIYYSESQELKQSRVDIVKLQQDNQTLQNQIHKLYDQMELDKQNLLQNQVLLLENQVKTQADQLSKAQSEITKYTSEIQQLQKRNQNISNLNFESIGIRCIPIFKGVQAQFYVTMYLLELMTPLSKILVMNEKVSLIIFQFINYIRKEKNDQIQSQTAIQLQDLIKIQEQNDNKANDFLFQIIDHLAKVIIKNDQQKSEIANIIQAQDSPIFDLFFFLQRTYPKDIEIQPNEVPLINSIKFVRFFQQIMAPQIDFCRYLNNLIQLEGQENKIDDKQTSFDFIIFPEYLIFNTVELSTSQADIQLSMNIPISCLNTLQKDSQYQLISIIHWVIEDNQIIYFITMQKNNTWVQIKQDYLYKIDINTILTFQQPHNNKELLIYEKKKI